MRLVHAADLHLDSPLRGLARHEGAPVEAVRGATRRALDRLVELCVEERAELLVVAGDIVDGDWPDFATGLHLASRLARLVEAGVRVVLVRGNHDAASAVTRKLRWPAGVVELPHERPGTVVLDALGVAVHGQGYARRAVDTDLAAAYPEPVAGLCNVGLLHTALDGRPGHDRYAPTSSEMLASKGYAYWALGHVHAREVVSRDPWIVFPGNLQGRHARETGPKGATLVEVVDGRVVSAEHRVLDVVRWAAVDVAPERARSGDDVVEAVAEALGRALEAADGRLLAARVTVRGPCDAHAALAADPERWDAEVRRAALELGADRVWVERVRLCTDPRLDLAELRTRDDPIGRLARSLAGLRGDEAALRALGEELAAEGLRLPREAREGEDGVRLDDPEQVRAALDDVERALLPRLLSDEGP